MVMLEKRIEALEAQAGIHGAEYAIVIPQHGESREQALARTAPGQPVRPIFVDLLGVAVEPSAIRSAPRRPDDPLTALLHRVACGHEHYLRPVADDPERVLREEDGDAD
ncbi:MAG TPA: hypothetical protein PKM45_00290 [Giesbergeria sp.]|nr:hypothetical protein [Giesbergeria sp.]